MKFNNANLTVELDTNNPENVIEANAGYYLYRDDREFWLISPTGNRQKIDVLFKSFALAYRNNIWYASFNTNEKYTFSNTYELWFKESGTGKIGWKFMGYKNLQT